MAPSDKELDRVTLIQAAIRLGMSHESVKRRIWTGQIAGGQSLGRYWWVSKRSLERYLADNPKTAA